jgi:diaminopimelate decarboxylase
LEIGGCDAVELGRKYQTPVYIVVEDDIRTRARAFREAFIKYTGSAESFDVVFASKAFGATAVFRLLAEENLGCDVASEGELMMALRAGFDPDRIYMHGNAKTQSEIERAVDKGVGHIVVDNMQDLKRLEQVIPPGRTQRILIRVAPGVSPDTHPSISTGGPNTKFGFNLQGAARRAIETARGSEKLQLEGLHFHIGSQIMETAPFRTALEAIVSLGSFPVISVGGGLGVVYSGDDQPPSIDEYVRDKVKAVHDVFGTGTRIIEEPGRALVANAGVTLYTIQSVKQNVDTWVAVDGGMSDNLRPMLYEAIYEAQIADRFGGGTRCHVTGKHCESGDVLVRDADLADPQPGDILVTPATGAYGQAMSNTYNGHCRPPVVFVRDGKDRLVVRRETIEDLFLRDIDG